MTPSELQKIIRKGENEHLEAKSGKGGFPDSIWESYSAFANTDGGIILLGVEESENQKLYVKNGLANAEKDETIKFPEITPEPGFVLSEYKLDTVGNLTDEDFAKLPRKCTVCGKDLNHEHIISAVDVKDKLHPICMECEMDLKEEAKLREMRAMAGVSTDKELIDWIIKISMLRKVLDVNSGT